MSKNYPSVATKKNKILKDMNETTAEATQLGWEHKAV